MTTRVGIYARLSLDQTGEGLNVADQVRRCTELAAERGWAVVETYEDNSKSGSGKIHRPGYERMLEDVRAGRIDKVMATKFDRLTRDLVEFGTLANLTLDQGVEVVLCSGRKFDVSSADAEFGTGIDMLLSRMERRKIGERLKDKHEQKRLKGRPPGGRFRTFGYTREWAQVEDEADIVRDAFERVAAGESVLSVSNSIIAKDVRTPCGHVCSLKNGCDAEAGTCTHASEHLTGHRWSYAATLRMVESPIYAGLLAYKGERTDIEVQVDGFEPIVSVALFDAAGARREKRPGRVNTRKALLSGIAVCGKVDDDGHECGTSMVGSTMAGRLIYVCNRVAGGCGNVNVKRDWIDAEIENYMRAMKWVEDVFGGTTVTPPEEVEARKAAAAERQVERARIEGEMREARDLRKAGRLSMGDLADVLSDSRAQLKVLDAADAAEVVQETHWQSMTEYREADVSRKAAEIRRYVSAVIVRPAVQRGRNSFDPARFAVELKDGTVIEGPEFVRRSAENEWHVPGNEAWDEAEARWNALQAAEVSA